MSLFRKEVLREHSQSYWGSTVLQGSGILLILTLAVVIFSAILLGLLFFGEFTRRTTLEGYVIHQGGALRVYSSLAGRVATLAVSEGKIVKRGEILLTILDERFGEKDIESRQAVVAQIEARKKSLKSIEMQQRQLFHTTRQGILGRKKSLEQELSQLIHEHRTLSQRLELSEDIENKFRALYEKKFISIVQMQEKMEASNELRYRVQTNERMQTSNSREINSLQNELDVLPMKEKEQLEEIDRSIQQLEQELIENQLKRQIVIRAAHAARVTGLTAFVGQTVAPTRPLMTLVPVDNPASALEVHLFASSKDAGFIKTGQNVKLRYQAFPYQKFGHASGSVIDISESPILSTELIYPMAEISNDPLYRIRVRLAQPYILAYGKRQELSSGMRVEADVMLDRRTLLEWIFEPIYSLRGKYFQ
ncbi:HlyD family efflux transporter periplasmic adaptor subunit [Verminephrobacter aporrectodeae subsp. tuberculatae]|uniref:HlyD family efflux transporter periplasmic adaptor subunit n=1 Tax=Verminephrobacter aporrectodeae subsp. tuberculatae TaxID=1110392 RepID=A0ABT3KSX3_9BURK|nr:HlyD family secretion protein [Verminephrobacter aporrectodeae]MCW5321386.1 HlyD family efflux transporter periplasmic adaptor subunit [Verminephrobacter aporrectodeae subsp. tuberculatae]MCW8198468.1 HlyD family efflux transporter periplasmic adaptor subunit [Verminephrobacter aporrectodeae subsp. tuberculatae]